MTTILERRRIEAEFIKIIYPELSARVGGKQAQEILTASIQKAARQQVDMVPKGSKSNLQTIVELLPVFSADGSLEIDILENTAERLAFNVTRCRFAEMYAELGIADLGRILSCGRDGEFFCALNQKIKFSRTETIMEGFERCDFRLELQD